MHVAHDGCIVFLPSEWYYHPATNLHFIRPLVGQGIGEAAVQRQRQYDVGKLFHRGDKDSGKWRENEMNGVIFYAEERRRLLWIWMKIRERLYEYGRYKKVGKEFLLKVIPSLLEDYHITV